MILGIQATRNFNDYSVFLRAMRVALSGMTEEDKSIVVFSAGPVKLNAMALEFCNVSENSLKSRGISIKLVKVSANILKDKIVDLDYFAFLSEPKENVSPLVREAEDKDVETGIFRY